jgi:hypothetical protein
MQTKPLLAFSSVSSAFLPAPPNFDVSAICWKTIQQQPIEQAKSAAMNSNKVCWLSVQAHQWWTSPCASANNEGTRTSDFIEIRNIYIKKMYTEECEDL